LNQTNPISLRQFIDANKAQARTLFWFVLVGSTAALVHLGVYALTTHAWLVPGECANALGFITAFLFSFLGHRYLSFQDTRTSVHRSAVRFFATALLGFLTNEGVFVTMFRGLDLNEWPSLILAIGCAAIQTFLLSRYWAFEK
jgi:putative flippase GtrA